MADGLQRTSTIWQPLCSRTAVGDQIGRTPVLRPYSLFCDALRALNMDSPRSVVSLCSVILYRMRGLPTLSALVRFELRAPSLHHGLDLAFQSKASVTWVMCRGSLPSLPLCAGGGCEVRSPGNASGMRTSRAGHPLSRLQSAQLSLLVAAGWFARPKARVARTGGGEGLFCGRGGGWCGADAELMREVESGRCTSTDRADASHPNPTAANANTYMPSPSPLSPLPATLWPAQMPQPDLRDADTRFPSSCRPGGHETVLAHGPPGPLDLEKPAVAGLESQRTARCRSMSKCPSLIALLFTSDIFLL
ncbi:hypothetical protein JHW43_005562 [Diplocarpon mali]|nr:hypothetical protein JHW43_005562 [Diplocarpon mali]